MKRLVQGIVCVAVAGVMATGGYMFGLKAQQSSITNASPRQSMSENEPPELDKEKQPRETQQSDSGKYIGKSNASSVDNTWSVVDKYSLDITGDGEDDTITLYTSAVSEDGTIIWDDSQKWSLEIYDGATYYTLMNQAVTNGNIYFDVMENEGNTTVNAYIITSAETLIKQYSYNKTGFVEKQVYSSGTGNNLHSSFPYYR